MKQNPKQDQCSVNERNGQLVFALNNEILLPENAPVRLTSAQLEELDYRKLYRAYSARGRKSKVDPRVLFKVMAYGYQCGIYSSRKLEEACRYRVDFMWLLEEEPVPDHTTLARFRTGRCTEAVEDLFYQYVALLERQGETDHETVFVDGPSWGRGRSSPWTSATKFRTYWADVNAVGEKNAASSNNLTFSIASLSKSISLNRPENFSALL